MCTRAAKLLHSTWARYHLSPVQLQHIQKNLLNIHWLGPEREISSLTLGSRHMKAHHTLLSCGDLLVLQHIMGCKPNVLESMIKIKAVTSENSLKWQPVNTSETLEAQDSPEKKSVRGGGSMRSRVFLYD